MTVIGWVQILLYCAIVVAITPVLGAYMTRVFNGERTFLSPILRPVEFAIYKVAGVNERQRAACGDLYGQHAAVPRRRLSHSLCADAPAGGTAVQSSRTVRRRAGSLVQHGDELHHQYQLAELRRRKHDVLPRADARPHASELPFRRNRHRAGDRAHPRLRAALGAHRRQFLGRYHPRARFTS